MNAFCPHCGYDLARDAPLFLNGFSMLGPDSPLYYNGQRIRLTGMEAALCWTLMKACPRPVRIDVILDRIGSEGEYNCISVLLTRIRKKLKAIGVTMPIEPMRHHGGRGYTWVVGAGNEVTEETVSKAA